MFFFCFPYSQARYKWRLHLFELGRPKNEHKLIGDRGSYIILLDTRYEEMGKLTGIEELTPC